MRHYLANSEEGMAALSANDAKVVFCSSKTEVCMIGYLSMTQGRHGYFCVGINSLPADDAREACFLLHRTAASELDGISEVPMGVNPHALS